MTTYRYNQTDTESVPVNCRYSTVAPLFVLPHGTASSGHETTGANADATIQTMVNFATQNFEQARARQDKTKFDTPAGCAKTGPVYRMRR